MAPAIRLICTSITSLDRKNYENTVRQQSSMGSGKH